MWQEREDNSVDPILTQPVWGEGKGKRERKEGESFRERERESTFSLDFPAISPLNSDETRGKVDPHRKSYTWVQVLWSSTTPGGKGLPLLGYFLSKNP